MSGSSLLAVAASAAALLGAASARPVALTSVSPAPAATAVAPATPVRLTFSRPMMPGMERYVDLHRGASSGPLVPLACAWNGDRTALTCTPDAPLAPKTHYTIHVGGGMADDQGRTLDLGHWTVMGGHWATGGMMGGMHAGRWVGLMAPAWIHETHYGMVFTFTTA
jgi:hypothetical protein